MPVLVVVLKHYIVEIVVARLLRWGLKSSYLIPCCVWIVTNEVKPTLWQHISVFFYFNVPYTGGSIKVLYLSIRPLPAAHISTCLNVRQWSQSPNTAISTIKWPMYTTHFLKVKALWQQLHVDFQFCQPSRPRKAISGGATAFHHWCFTCRMLAARVVTASKCVHRCSIQGHLFPYSKYSSLFPIEKNGSLTSQSIPDLLWLTLPIVVFLIPLMFVVLALIFAWHHVQKLPGGLMEETLDQLQPTSSL